ncbi:zonadhesin-like [Ochlerotatus camptorhynchus]|uniref:zonadhesin-like n=1 Tax=Ochlerotatus camptorhynchus TaxID=644619 RepID=UPI0031D61927
MGTFTIALAWISLLVISTSTTSISLRNLKLDPTNSTDTDTAPKNRTSRQFAAPCPYQNMFGGSLCSAGVQPISMLCPAGSVLENGQCVVRQSYCPGGFTLAGNTCVGATTCPSGYSLSNNMCNRQPIKVPDICTKNTALPTCQAGYTFSNGQCVKHDVQSSVMRNKTSLITASARCPEGYQIDGQNCLFYERRPATCAQGELRLGECVVPAVCQPPYTMDSFGRCEQSIQQPSACPPGSRFINGICQYGAPTCPQGYRFSNRQCILERTVSVQCANGTSMINNYCFVSEAKCPTGYESRNSQCVQVRYDQLRCPAGSTIRDNVCVVQEVSCPAGYEQKDSRCSRFEKQPVICPYGSSLRNGVCVSEQEVCRRDYTYDERYGRCMKYDQRPVSCPAGFTLRGEECVTSVNCDMGYILQNGECIRMEKSSEKCPMGSQLRNGMCITAQPSCEVGYQFENGVCVRHDRRHPACPNGSQYIDGNCRLQNVGCRPQYRLRDGQCVLETSIQPRCPSGYTFLRGYCLTRPYCDSEYTLQGGLCRKQIFQSVICPAGSNLQDGVCVSNDFDCITGFEMHNNMCVRRHTTSATCSGNAEFRNGQCLIKTTPSCPFGAAFSNGMCTTVQTIAPTCPAGYSYANGMCHGTMVSNVAQQAPSPCITGVCNQQPCGYNNYLCGAQQNCGSCGQTQQAQYITTTQAAVCPAGYVSANGMCTRQQTIPKQCPPSHTMQDNECVLYIAPVCEHGSVMENGRCVRLEQMPLSCRAGFILRDNRCVYMSPECGVGFHNIGGKCTQAHEVQPRCPSNHKLLKNFCVAQAECSFGYELRENACYKIEYEAPQCPPNFMVLDDYCVTTIQCEHGYSFENQTCTKSEQRSVNCPPGSRHFDNFCIVPGPACDPGFSLQNGECELMKRKPIVCPPGSFLQRDFCVVQAVCNQGYQMISGQCTRHELVPTQCPSGFYVEGNRCTSKRLTCPNGFNQEGAECVRHNYETMTCPAGTTYRNNLCIKGQPSCDFGFKEENNRCVRYSYQTVQCPPGAIMMENRCVMNPTCPTGYRFSRGQCIQIQYASMTCKEGTLYNGNCMAPGPDCPVGYHFSEGQCTKKDHINPTCLSGGKLQQKYCVVGTPICPIDFKHTNAMCLKISTATATCPPSYTSRDGRCVSEVHSFDYVCNAEYTLQGSQCMKTLYAAASCSAGYTLQGGICESVTCTAAPQPQANVQQFVATVSEISSLPSSSYTKVSETSSFNSSSYEAVSEVTHGTNTEEQIFTCTVYSPKICTNNDDVWDCTHEVFSYVRSRYCVEDNASLYLTLDETSYDDESKILIMAAKGTDQYVEEYDEDYRSEIDCSGCTYGEYSCSKSCYEYECEECRFISMRDFCSDHPKPTQGCSIGEGCRGDFFEQVAEEATANPFAKGGLPRSPEHREPNKRSKSPRDAETTAGIGGQPEEQPKDWPGLIRTMNSFGPLPRLLAIAGQLDAIIEFTSTKSNIAKDLKQALRQLRANVNEAQDDHERLRKRLEVAERAEQKEPKSTQTDAFNFAGNNTMSSEALHFAVTQGQKRNRPSPSPVKGAARPKRRKVSVQVESAVVDVPKKRAGIANRNTEKPSGSKGGKQGGKKGTPPKPPKPPKPPDKTAPKSSAARTRNKGEALILKTDASKYAEVLKKMRTDERLVEMGSNVRSIRRTRTGEMLLVLKRGAKDQGPTYQKLAKEVVGSGVQVKSLGSTITIQVKDLDEVTEATEIVTALREQCQVEVPQSAITLRKGPFSTQVATIRLSAAEARKAVAAGRVRVGWSVCPVSIPRPVTACFRCFGQGHVARDCKNTDRSKLCRWWPPLPGVQEQCC